MMFYLLLLCLVSVCSAVPSPHPRHAKAPHPKASRDALDPRYPKRSSPSVTFSQGTVDGSSDGVVDSFKSIPFAQSPTGDLRLKPPQAITSDLGTIDGTVSSPTCPQFFFDIDDTSIPEEILAYILDDPAVQKAADESEDCLYLNVLRPSNATADSNLPVLFWMYGGAFEFGSVGMYDGTAIVKKSIELGQPIIFVETNYRVAGFGFLAGKEILADGSANLGLRDQRLALEWVADNIAYFGGDADKVTIWGESAGSISVCDQMLLYDGDNTYNGNALFRGAIMNSGTISPAVPVDSAKAQAVYDQVADYAGCSNSSDSLSCLRSLSYQDFLSAANSVPGLFDYQGAALSYLPRPDGTVLTDSPEALVAAGKYAAVPFIVGDQQDEGTIFSLVQNNLTSTADLIDYFQTYYFPNASAADLADFVATYPDDAAAGSPYGTGDLYELYGQYKRLASILGDWLFILVRRYFLRGVATHTPALPTWSYLATYDHGRVPFLGTYHGSDLAYDFPSLPSFPSDSILTYYVAFVNALDPNNNSAGLVDWPVYAPSRYELLQLGLLENTLTTDDFRAESFAWIEENLAVLRQ